MSNHRILLIAYPAQGHLNPALQFAKNLIRLGAHVTFTTTLHMHRRMSNKPTNLPNLSFLPFSDGHDDGYDAAGDPDADHTLYLSQVRRRGSEFIADLVTSAARDGIPFTCLVYTILHDWAAETARGLHLPSAVLWVQPSATLNILYHYFHGYGSHIKDKITKEPSTPSLDLPGLPLLQPNRDLPSILLDLNSGMNSLIVSMFEDQFRELDLETKPKVLVNTFESLEAETLKAVDEFDVIPIGPLVPSALLEGGDPADRSSGGDVFERENGLVEWLDSKAEGSVVYVSFGSFCVLPKKQMEEIGRALLDCGCPFLWVIKENEKKKGEEEEELDKYREELEQSEKGKIVKWCSQVEVLSHASVGCFVTHCGWNSTLESLVLGVPVVAFPQWIDQKTNAKLIEDVWETGVRVDHNVNEEGVVEAGEIRRCLDLVAGSGEKGDELRRNANKWKGFATEAGKEGGPSENNLRTFLDDIGRRSRLDT